MTAGARSAPVDRQRSAAFSHWASRKVLGVFAAPASTWANCSAAFLVRSDGRLDISFMAASFWMAKG